VGCWRFGRSLKGQAVSRAILLFHHAVKTPEIKIDYRLNTIRFFTTKGLYFDEHVDRFPVETFPNPSPFLISFSIFDIGDRLEVTIKSTANQEVACGRLL
jgi:hypothetical protein